MLIPPKVLSIFIGLLLFSGLQQYQTANDFDQSPFKGSTALAETVDASDYNDVSEMDDFGNRISRFSATSKFPLYAMIKSENIYLYGIQNNSASQGMILYLDDEAVYFDWPDLAGSFGWMPEMSFFDYDEDGERELAVVVYTDKGTGCSKTDIHILKPRRDEWGGFNYISHSLQSEDIKKWFTEKFTTKFIEDKKQIVVGFCGNDYYVDLREFAKNYGVDGDSEQWIEIWKGLEGASYGEIINFSLEENGEISVSIGIGFVFEDWDITSTYFGNVEAKVNFDGYKFFLSDYQFNISPT